MNQQYAGPHPPCPYNPINPSPYFSNPQFNFPPLPQWPPPPPPPQPQLQKPLPDLPNSLSSLKTLIQSSNSTLQSLSSLLPSLSVTPTSLIQCPSNSHHWVPSSFLFKHSLSCPTPLDVNFDMLQYPKTLKADQNLIKHSKIVQPINARSSELCFSIDDYVDLDCNYFYKDCPGVVSSSDIDVSERVFTIPGVLSVECANFVGCGDEMGDGFEGSSVKLLPSEVWFVGREVEQWSDYPNEYSLCTIRAILCVECVKVGDLSMWVIENSPKFGVVLDMAMRDHLCILCRLCLKAIVREAVCTYRSILKRYVDDNIRVLNPPSLRFKCPVLVEVLRWLTSHVGILYGEMNAKALVIAMVRHLFSEAAAHVSLFPLGLKSDQPCDSEQTTDVSRNKPSRLVTQCHGDSIEGVTISRRPIFLYQIAAAIAALRERSLLEAKIRTLRNPTQLTAYQRSAEHSYFSNKALEERQKRPDYRPLIDHDGLPNQRQNDQGNNNPKTKEELLAEERDYKRRRMSYRGKKLKRSGKEVMRDIIEEYMEAIKHTGGIGGPAQEPSEGAVLASAHSSGSGATSFKLNHSSRNDMQDDHSILLDDDFKYQDTHTSRNHERHKKDSYSHRNSEDRRATSRDKHTKDYLSRSPSRERKHHRSNERRSYSRNRAIEVSQDERSKSNFFSSRRSKDHDRRVLDSTSTSLRHHSGRKGNRESESPHRQKRRQHTYGRSESFERDGIFDRYDPSEANDQFD